MKPLNLPVHGIVYRRQEAYGLFLQAAAARLNLRFAFVVQGTEKLIFPALVLDDWGRERSSLSLYRWIYEQGQRFPRAEVFGFDSQGRETQIFLRDLEIFFNYPCYLYPGATTPFGEGVRLTHIFTAGEEDRESLGSAETPAGAPWPLQHAAVTWQRATSATLAAAGWQLLPRQAEENSADRDHE